MDFKQWLEAVKPCGDCFRWAIQNISKYPDGVVVHGIVTAPFSMPPHSYIHAWIEANGMVYDWQTMAAGHGGNFMGKGYPLETFYELYSPKNIKKYTMKQVLALSVKNRHFGPWEKNKGDMV